MSERYKIAWKHRTDYGQKGVGTKEFPKHEAEVLAAELNKEYPKFEHTPVPASDWPAHYPSHD